MVSRAGSAGPVQRHPVQGRDRFDRGYLCSILVGPATEARRSSLAQLVILAPFAQSAPDVSILIHGAISLE
jgi:hypothetical protein